MSKPRVLESVSPPSPEPGTVLFETERLIIRRWLPSDAAALAEAGNHIEISSVMSDRFPAPYLPSNAEEYIADIFKPSEDTISLNYPTTCGIFLKDPTETRVVGSIGTRFLQDIFYRSWELGYFMNPAFWGHGYATEAVGAFVRWCMDTWTGLVRIEGRALEGNRASARVMEKSGFVHEGVRRMAVEKGGVLMDDIGYGFVRSDYEAEKGTVKTDAVV